MPVVNKDLSYCIVWSPLPPITWILPFVGHTGIADSAGIVSDFRGPYFVGDDGRMAFGAPTRALKIDIKDMEGGAERWDLAIEEANEVYRYTKTNKYECITNHVPRNGITHSTALSLSLSST
jgi:hypothetical protein